MSILIPSLAAAAPLVRAIPPDARRLAEAFFPGPLTLILPKSERVPDAVTGGRGSVAIRVPNHPAALELLRLCGAPLACPSANFSGEPSPKTLEAALKSFDGLAECAIDGGECAVGRESTIIDLAVFPYNILRRGGLSKRKIAECLGQRVEGLTVIGITGGSGAGKTTALGALKSLGALVLDCDMIYRELTDSNTDMLEALESRFPGVVKDGVLDRRALAGVVFTDKTALAALNKITHAYVDRECAARIAAFTAEGGSVAAIDAVALIESGLADFCDVNIAVTAPRETRIRRIMERDKISEMSAELRIGAQQTEEFFASGCDFVLSNEYADERGFFDYCLRIFKNILEEF